jgi:hypothetical protein
MEGEMNCDNRRRHAKTAFALATLFTFGMAASSRAAPIRYDFGGVITSAPSGDGINLGDRFSGTFTYDPSKPDGPAMSIEGLTTVTYGQYTGSPPVGDGPGMTIEVNGRSITNGLASLAITHSWPAYSGQPGPLSSSVAVSSSTMGNDATTFSLVFTQPESSIPAMDPLPQALRLSDFSTANLSIWVAGSFFREHFPGPMRGTIDTLREVPVPEPTLATSLCLVAIGLMASYRARARFKAGTAPRESMITPPDRAGTVE